MKIAVRFGHLKHGQDAGAVGIKNEYDLIRQYGPYVISGLQKLGNQVLNVTPQQDYLSMAESLNYGINKANNWGADLFVSCHVNAFSNPSANGCEVLYYSSSSKGKEIATNICKQVSKLAFYNRGAKADSRGLAELKRTNMPAVIVEPLFCTSSKDINLFNAQKIGYAICEGITGKIVRDEPIQPISGDNWVARLQTEINKQFGVGLVVDGIAGPKTLRACPTCRNGARGGITKLFQEKLNSFGYGTNGIDGIFGQGTYNAVIAYQKSKGLSSDGIVGQNTWRALLGL